MHSLWFSVCTIMYVNPTFWYVSGGNLSDAEWQSSGYSSSFQPASQEEEQSVQVMYVLVLVHDCIITMLYSCTVLQ